MKKQNANSKDVELAFPKYESEKDYQYISKGSTCEGMVKHLSTSMDSIADWFKQYQVESIELWISGLIESGTVTKLVVSAKGEGGMKVILKPKSKAKYIVEIKSKRNTISIWFGMMFSQQYHYKVTTLIGEKIRY